MNGTIVRFRPKGVEAQMDATTDSLTEANKFEVYRNINGVDVVLGTFYAKRSKGPGLICLNVVGDTPGTPEFPANVPLILGSVQVGDLVRSV